MKSVSVFIIILWLVFGVISSGTAGNTAVQRVTFRVLPINEISVKGNPQELIVRVAPSDSQPKEIMDMNTTYAITTNGKKKITGKIDTPMPTGTALKINLGAPKGSIAAGDVPLTTNDADLVLGINKVAAPNLKITYKFSALYQGGEVSGSRAVVLTLVDGN